MSKRFSIIIGICILLVASNILGAEENTTAEQIQLLTLSKIQKVSAASSNFTGIAEVTPIFSRDTSKLSSGIVNFKAGARTNWHIHPRGQMLVIIEGKGWTQQWNGDIVEFKKGDVVWIPAGVKHWHGAAPDTDMSHLAIAPEDENQKSTDWLEKVSDEQYKK